MRTELGLGIAFLAGAALGGLYFAGLWWTVKNACHAKRPAWRYVGSFFLRALVAGAGFYLIGAGSGLRLAASLMGFMAARYAALLLSRQEGSAAIAGKDNRRAP